MGKKMKIKTKILSTILSATLACSTFAPSIYAKINFKKIIKVGTYATLGLGVTGTGIFTVMMCYTFGAIGVFNKPTKIKHLRRTILSATVPALICAYTAYRMFRNACKSLKK